MLLPSLSLPPAPKVRLLEQSTNEGQVFVENLLCTSLAGCSSVESLENDVDNAL